MKIPTERKNSGNRKRQQNSFTKREETGSLCENYSTETMERTTDYGHMMTRCPKPYPENHGLGIKVITLGSDTFGNPIFQTVLQN